MPFIDSLADNACVLALSFLVTVLSLTSTPVCSVQPRCIISFTLTYVLYTLNIIPRHVLGTLAKSIDDIFMTLSASRRHPPMIPCEPMDPVDVEMTPRLLGTPASPAFEDLKGSCLSCANPRCTLLGDLHAH